MSPAEKEKRLGGRRALRALVCCLIVLAAFLAATAAWMWHSRGRRPGELSVEPGDAVERRIEAFMPDLVSPYGWIKAGGLPQDILPQRRFVCPQCQSSCWTHPRRGPPACPFCGRAMTRQGPGPNLDVAGGWIQAGGLPQSTPAGGAASPVAIWAGAIRVHGDRGVCTNCHTVVRSGSLLSALNPVGGAQGTLKAFWSGMAAPFDRNARGALMGLERAPAIAPEAVRPTLIKEFGIEVRSANGAGAKVTGVMGNSYASNAGLRAGDFIIKCNGRKVGGVEEFQQLVSRAPPEADVRITIMRNGRTRDLSIMVGEGEMEGFTPIQRP